MKKKKAAKSRSFAPVLQMVLYAAVTYVLLSAMLFFGAAPEQHDQKLGSRDRINERRGRVFRP